MASWEYKFINLYRGGPGIHPPYTKTEDTEFAAFAAEVRQAGADGWEAVGEVRVTFGGTNMRVLMLKRSL